MSLVRERGRCYVPRRSLPVGGRPGLCRGRQPSVQDQDEAPNRANPLVQATLLGEALEGAHAAAILFDEDRNCVAVNAHACVLTGYTRAELLALPVDVGGELEEVAAHRRHAGLTELRRKDGSTFGVSYRVIPTNIGGISFFLGIFWPNGSSHS